ncbi:hypothetical protein PMAYCL1PPCAC_19137, partial [Pristionchus mayeri]
HISITDEPSSVAFHDRITTENVIPSDVADDALIKTPARVPNAPGAGAAAPQQQQYLPLTAVMPASTGEASVSKAVSEKDGNGKGKSTEATKNSGRKGKGSSKKTTEGPLSKS